MKYVCKDKFIKVLPLGHGMFSVLEFDVGDILEYIGMDEHKNCEFKTDGGYCIRLSSKAVDDLLEELKEPIYYKFSGLLNRLSKIEYEIAELRVEMEEIMREAE